MDLLRHRGRLAVVAPPLIGVVLMNIAGPLIGDTPDTRDTRDEMVAYFTEHRDAVMAGVALTVVVLTIFLWTATQVGAVLDRSGWRTAGRFVPSAGGVAVAIVAIGMMLPVAAVSYVVAAEEPEAARGLFLMSLVSASVAAGFLGSMLLVAGVALWVSRATRRWFAVVAAVLGVLVVVGVGGYAFRGFFSPDVQQQVVFAGLTAWLLTVGFALPVDRAPARSPDTI